MALTWTSALETLRTDDHEAALQRLRRYAQLMDSAVRIPFTRVTFGLEPALGLIPVVGDAAGALLACYVPFEAIRLGAPWSLVLKMMFNIAVDALLGVFPLLGDAFDVFWKANVRNVRLLEEYLTA